MDNFKPEMLLHSLMNAKHAFMRPLVVIDMPSAEFLVLHRIKGMQLRGEDITVSALNAHADGRTMSSTSQVLGSLEAKGLVIRTVSPGDRRKVSVSLTDEGEALMHKVHGRMDAILHEFVDRFGAENAAQLCALIDDAVQIFRDIKNETDFFSQERND